MKLVISSFPAMIFNSDGQDKYYCLFCVWNTILSLVVEKRHLIATTMNISVELKTVLCLQNTNHLILHCIYCWQRIRAQLVHRDDLKLQCLNSGQMLYSVLLWTCQCEATTEGILSPAGTSVNVTLKTTWFVPLSVDSRGTQVLATAPEKSQNY